MRLFSNPFIPVQGGKQPGPPGTGLPPIEGPTHTHTHSAWDGADRPVSLTAFFGAWEETESLEKTRSSD